MSALLLLLACWPDPPQVDDTGAADAPLFDAAVLDPPFVHTNAVWAGVALLDFDDDGWLDLFFTNGRAVPDALYRNLGDGTFVDVAASAGVDSLGETGAVVSGDIDNDGDADLIVSEECTTGTYGEDTFYLLDSSKRLYLNEGDGTFSEHELEVDERDAPFLTQCTVSLALADLDHDGNLDLILSNSHDPDIAPPWAFYKEQNHTELVVLLGDGSGRFDDSLPPPWPRSSFVAVPLDVDGDGRLDLLQGSVGYGLRTFLGNPDGDQEFVFDEARSESGRGLWMGIAVADFDGDLDLDLYATNEGLSSYIQGYDNLDAVAEFSSVYSVSAYSDPNDPAGGTTLSGDRVNPFHTLLLDDDGVYRVAADWPLDAPQLLAGDLFDGLDGLYDQWMDPQDLERLAWAWGTVPLDFDADGWVDVAFTGNNCGAPMDVIWDEARGAGPGGLFRNAEGAGFEDWTWSAGVANLDDQGRYQDGRGMAVGDLNNDGYADYVVANRTYNPSQTDPMAQEIGTPHVWLSHPRDGHWLQLDLVGTTSNRDGVGARVTLTGADRTWLHPFGAEGATSSSSERLLTMGLGDTDTVDVEVLWPSGEVTTLSDVAVDQRLVVEEGQ